MGVLALAAVLLITGTLRGVGPLQRAQGAGADVMRPFEIVAHKVASPFVDTYDYFSGLFSASWVIHQKLNPSPRSRCSTSRRPSICRSPNSWMKAR